MMSTDVSLVGLGAALLGPGLVAWASVRLSEAPTTLVESAGWLLLFAALVAAVATIARRGERLGWGQVGFGRVSRMSVPCALALTLFFIGVYGPVVVWALAAFDAGFETGAARFAGLPSWYLGLTIVVVAGGEEWLYRGYAIERLQVLTGNAWVAGLISLVVFSVVHLPVWGVLPSLTTAVSGGILTALYVWRRDVLCLILAHVATDLYGLVIVR